MSGAVRGVKHDESKGKPGRTAYRAGCHCEECRRDAAAAKKQQRDRANARRGRPRLYAVPREPVEQAGEPPAATPEPEPPAPHHVPAYGAVEKAVHDDIEQLPAETPFLAVLKATALALARELDDVDAKGSKASAARQMTEIVRELKEKGPEGVGDSIESLLGAPTVPTGEAAVPDPHAP